MSGNDGQGQKKANQSSHTPGTNHAATSRSYGSIAAASNRVEPPVQAWFCGRMVGLFGARCFKPV